MHADATVDIYHWSTEPDETRADYLDAVIRAVVYSAGRGDMDAARAALELFAAEERDEARSDILEHYSHRLDD